MTISYTETKVYFKYKFAEKKALIATFECQETYLKMLPHLKQLCYNEGFDKLIEESKTIVEMEVWPQI
jgi:hypothetical protein